MADTDRYGAKLMTNVRMCDRLDRAIDKITVLGEIFRAADSDMNTCKSGLAIILDDVLADVAEVYETIDARREAEAEIKRDEVTRIEAKRGA